MIYLRIASVLLTAIIISPTTRCYTLGPHSNTRERQRLTSDHEDLPWETELEAIRKSEDTIHAQTDELLSLGISDLQATVNLLTQDDIRIENLNTVLSNIGWRGHDSFKNYTNGLQTSILHSMGVSLDNSSHSFSFNADFNFAVVKSATISLENKTFATVRMAKVKVSGAFSKNDNFSSVMATKTQYPTQVCFMDESNLLECIATNLKDWANATTTETNTMEIFMEGIASYALLNIEETIIKERTPTTSQAITNANHDIHTSTTNAKEQRNKGTFRRDVTIACSVVLTAALISTVATALFYRRKVVMSPRTMDQYTELV
eukprot:m.339753 g.339753  ORF g.339753 m.339753 type:complete len:319 (+) comp18951_c0_seq1:351-1307(+)